MKWIEWCKRFVLWYLRRKNIHLVERKSLVSSMNMKMNKKFSIKNSAIEWKKERRNLLHISFSLACSLTTTFFNFSFAIDFYVAVCFIELFIPTLTTKIWNGKVFFLRRNIFSSFNFLFLHPFPLRDQNRNGKNVATLQPADFQK